MTVETGERLRLCDRIEAVNGLEQTPLLYLPETGKYVRVSPLGLEVLRLIEQDPGATSCSVSRMLRERHRRGGHDDVRRFLDELSRVGVIVQNGSTAPRSRRRPIFPLLRLGFWRPDRQVARRLMDWIRRRNTTVVAGTVSGLVTLLATVALLSFASTTAPGFEQARWIGVALLMALHMALHEAAHALVSSYYGIKIRELGAGLLYFCIPVFYSDRTDGYRLQTTTPSIFIALAGPAFDISAAGVTALAVAMSQGRAATTLRALLVSQVLLFVANLNPLFPTDAYHAIEAACGELNFRRRAFSVLRHRLLCRELPSSLRGLTAARQLFCCAYALLSTVFAVFALWLFVRFGWLLVSGLRGQ
jgi:putative peptide zinc metalloprotease protein